MNAYSLEWSDFAVEELAAVWLAAPRKTELSFVIDLIEQGLVQAPLKVGKPARSTVRRIILLPPIGITFDVVEDDKKVIVQACWFVHDN